MTNVMGIDLSLTSTGIALVDNDGVIDDSTPEAPNAYHFGRVVTTKTITSIGRKDATLEERADRLLVLVERIAVEATGVQLAIIEGPSYGQGRQGGQHDRAGLWWLVVERLLEMGLLVVEVAPASRSRYATGKGNAAKDAVLAAVIRRYISVAEVAGNDQADALVLAAMGARWIGAPIDDPLPQTHLDAMPKVHWPAVDAATV